MGHVMRGLLLVIMRIESLFARLLWSWPRVNLNALLELLREQSKLWVMEVDVIAINAQMQE